MFHLHWALEEWGRALGIGRTGTCIGHWKNGDALLTMMEEGGQCGQEMKAIGNDPATRMCGLSVSQVEICYYLNLEVGT